MSEQTDTPEQNIYNDQRSVALRTTQSVYFVQEHDKVSMLGLLLNDHKENQVVIVVKSKKKADALSAFLISKDFKALCVHGNHRQEQQQEAAAHFNLGNTLKGLNKLLLNNDKIHQDLEDNWVVVAEAIQTILRRENYPNPYEALKGLTRTNDLINQKTMAGFIDGLDISKAVKTELKSITPSNYTGI